VGAGLVVIGIAQNNRPDSANAWPVEQTASIKPPIQPPKSGAQVAVVTNPPPVNPPPTPKTTSTYGRSTYLCAKSNELAQIATIKKKEIIEYANIYANMFALIPDISDVPGGLKIILSPSVLPLARENINPAWRITVELRKLGNELLGIFTADYDNPLYGRDKIPLGSDEEVKRRGLIEKMAMLKSGDCELQ